MVSVEHRPGQQLLELGVLVLLRLQPPGVGNLQTAVLRLPSVKRRAADPVLAADILARGRVDSLVEKVSRDLPWAVVVCERGCDCSCGFARSVASAALQRAEVRWHPLEVNIALWFMIGCAAKQAVAIALLF
jgi:hypothetical protein